MLSVDRSSAMVLGVGCSHGLRPSSPQCLKRSHADLHSLEDHSFAAIAIVYILCFIHLCSSSLSTEICYVFCIIEIAWSSHTAPPAKVEVTATVPSDDLLREIQNVGSICWSRSDHNDPSTNISKRPDMSGKLSAMSGFTGRQLLSKR